MGNRAAQAAAVGVAGAEVGCPEMDDGRALTGRTRDGRGTERTQGKQRETDTQTVSEKSSRRTEQSSTDLERNTDNHKLHHDGDTRR